MIRTMRFDSMGPFLFKTSEMAVLLVLTEVCSYGGPAQIILG